jgi:hypothetical protein
MLRLLKVRFLVFLLLMGFASPAAWSAQGPVHVGVTVIIASDDAKASSLEKYTYREQLTKLFSYKSYRQVGQSTFALDKSERNKIDLAQGYELVLTLQGIENDRILLQAVIRKEREQFIDTVMAIKKPGVAFLGGPALAEGNLIISIEAAD